MTSKEFIVVKPDEKEIRNFLDRLIAAGYMSVDLDSELFGITIRREKISEEGRRILTRGGPGGLE